MQDKYIQKMHFKQNGVSLPEFMKVDSVEDAEEAGKQFGYPLMLKSRRDAYDGRGNAVAQSKEALSLAISSLGGVERGLYAEKWAPFVKELAVMVARGRNGCIRSFPVVETTHVSNICHTVEAPAQIPAKVAELAMQVAERAVGSLTGAGMFGVELFLLEDGNVLLNEVAPRRITAAITPSSLLRVPVRAAPAVCAWPPAWQPLHEGPCLAHVQRPR